MLESRAGARRARRRFVPAVVAAAILALVGAAGCQSNPEPPPISGDESSSSPTPSPPTQAAPPSLPAKAQGTSEASAKAFVRHYFRTLKYAMNQGDVEQLKALSHKDCESCQTIVENIDSTYASGGEISSQGWIVQSISLVPAQPADKPIVDLGIMISAERVTERAGAKPRRFPGGRQPMTMYLEWDKSDGWRVTRLDRVS